ncbi:MAG: ABC transporter permease [Clostridiales bacterium]|nr:ABC transporter permease [Clostridiales bacterium]
MLIKSTIREITKSLGRYLAIIAIVALGVGFFAGLIQATNVMVTTVDKLVTDQNLSDFQMISSLGFEPSDVDKIKSHIKSDQVSKVEAFKSHDFIYEDNERVSGVVKAISLPEKNVDMPKVSHGRLPKKSDECLADDYIFSKDDIGRTISIAKPDGDKDEEKTAIDSFKTHSFKIVGIGSSPLYLNKERGYTNLGNGNIEAFIYVPVKAFATDFYTSVNFTLKDRPKIYTKEYESLVDYLRKEMSSAMKIGANSRYDRLVKDVKDKVNAQFQSMGIQNAPESAIEEATRKIDKPVTYLLDRRDNPGYSAFERDANIVRGIANVFPAFFFLVAALVVMTSMARLVDEQRTEIGVLKALGYRDGSILGKYLFYAGSATVIGTISGYLLGSYIFPLTIWNAYQAVYHFDTTIRYPHDIPLGIATLIVCVAGALGATLIAFHEDRKGMPASLIIPKAPKEGKRIFLEKVPFLWKHFSFLYKVTFRNIFRYKKRLFMMILGIGGCTALLLTGFGINDSIKNVANFQYEDITLYDFAITFHNDMRKREKVFIKSVNSIDDAMFFHGEELRYKSRKSNVNLKLVATDKKDISKFINLKMHGKKLNIPDKGKIIICEKLAEEEKIHIGSKINLKTKSGKSADLIVSDITENFIDNYIYMSTATYEESFGDKATINSAFANIKGIERPASLGDEKETDKIMKAAVDTMGHSGVSGTIINRDNYTRIKNMMNSLDSVIAVICLAAAGLALIVLYNLSNISITERVREIATIKVLGFYPHETALYIFRESTFLTAFGAAIGLGLGHLLHAFVMHQIKVEMIYFHLRIAWYSYLISFGLTMLFACLVNLIMYFKIRRINMIDSLKSME